MQKLIKVVASANWSDGNGTVFTVAVWTDGRVLLTSDKSKTPIPLGKLAFRRRQQLGTKVWGRVLRDALKSSCDSKELVVRLKKQTLLDWSAV